MQRITIETQAGKSFELFFNIINFSSDQFYNESEVERNAMFICEYHASDFPSEGHEHKITIWN